MLKVILLFVLLTPIIIFAVDVDNPLGETDIQEIIGNIVNAILGVVGLVAVAMIVYGGVLFSISGGNQDTLDKAKKTITYAVVGLIIALLSYAIVNFIIGAVEGS